MSENVSDEEKVVKKALREEYLKEIAQKLNKKTERVDAVTVDGKGELYFGFSIQEPNILAGLVRYLAIELADTKAELWLKNYKTSSVA